MKHFLLSFFILTLPIICHGQQASIECAKQYSIYKEFMKVGSYDLAVEPYWDVVGECPGFSKRLYDDGIRIYHELIMKVADSVSVHHYLDTIRNLYARKADVLKLDSLEVGNAYLQRCFLLAGNGKISPSRLFDEIMPWVERLADAAENPYSRALNSTVAAGSAKYLKTFNKLVCSRYSLPEAANDVDRLMRIMDILGACHNDLYLSALEQMQLLWKSYSIAARLGALSMDMGYKTKARNYLSDAVRLSKQWEIDDMVSSDPPAGGLGYLTIASIYLNYASLFGLDAFETSEIYWVAADYALKARNNPQLVEKADKIIAECKARFPKKDEAFMHSVKPGDRVTLMLFDTESTSARF
ncbi:MAG: hypothetical protein MJZ66_11165 [Bacteroidales bacterium]|nr:hypothetical protein [Bacteroidales bacterium]